MRFLSLKLDFKKFKYGMAEYMDINRQVLHHHNLSETVFNQVVPLLEHIGWPDEDNWWKWREELRLLYRTATPLPEAVNAYMASQLESWPAADTDYYVSWKGDNMITYVPSNRQKRSKDVREEIRLTRFITRTLGGTEDIARRANELLLLGNYSLNFIDGDDEDEWVRIYEKGPDSCMRIRGHSRYFNLNTHPVRIYATPDFKLAYLTNNDNNEVVSRGIINKQTNTLLRGYGDGRLVDILNQEGVHTDVQTAAYGTRYPTADDARLKFKFHPDRSDHIIAPYMDCAYQGFKLHPEDPEYLTVIPESQHFNSGSSSREMPFAAAKGSTRGSAIIFYDDRQQYFRASNAQETLLEEAGLGNLILYHANHGELPVRASTFNSDNLGTVYINKGDYVRALEALDITEREQYIPNPEDTNRGYIPITADTSFAYYGYIDWINPFKRIRVYPRVGTAQVPSSINRMLTDPDSYIYDLNNGSIVGSNVSGTMGVSLLDVAKLRTEYLNIHSVHDAEDWILATKPTAMDKLFIKLIHRHADDDIFTTSPSYNIVEGDTPTPRVNRISEAAAALRRRNERAFNPTPNLNGI